MNLNPYEPANSSPAGPQNRDSRWLLWAGGVSLALAVLCLIVTVAGMMWTFQATSESTATENPADLADDLSIAVTPSLIAVPLALLGIVLLILGWIRSRAAAKS